MNKQKKFLVVFGALLMSPIIVSYQNCGGGDRAETTTGLSKGTGATIATQGGGPSNCSFSFFPLSAATGSNGGDATLNVSGLPSCAWQASSDVNWIDFPQGAKGSGNGALQYTVAANPGALRTGTITIGNQSFSVTQSGSSGCASFALGPSNMIVNVAGSSSRKFSVLAGAGCAWSAASNDPWISIVSGSNGNGNGTVTFTVAVNNGSSPRTGTINVSNQVFSVYQDGSAHLVHPRIWMTPGDQQKFSSWAVPSNPMYQQGLVPVLQAAIAKYNQYWPTGNPIPSGSPTAGWLATEDSGFGASNYVKSVTEAYAEFFAFMSLIDPDSTARAAHAMRARNMLMFILNQAALGPDNSQNPAPFRDVHFSTYNRAGFWGEAFGLTVDWLYPSGVLTAQDKQAIQKVYMRWASENLVAATSGNEHPQPLGVMNDLQLLGSGVNSSPSQQAQLRWAANNYYSSHARQLTLLTLGLDPADDPPVNANQPASSLGNTLRSYINHVTGAWLYQQYAVYEQPATVKSVLGVPGNNPSLGVASGGLSVEGFLYGTSLGYVFEELLALHTAGYDDVNLSGPQINLVSSSYWDMFVDGFLSSIAPTAQTYPQPNTWLGPLYSMASYGENLNFYITPDYITPFGALGVFDQRMANQQRLNKDRWIAANVLQGGSSPQYLYARAGGQAIWNNSVPSQTIFYYMLFDPTANPGAAQVADPRPNISPTFYSPSFGRILARTDWVPDASFFSYLANWEWLSHQNGSAGQFEFYRKGEWLTKEWSGYSNDGLEITPLYHNVLSIQNNTPSDPLWFESGTIKYGGQWTVGQNMGDPKTVASFGTNYVNAFSDLTTLYNRVTSNTPGVTVVQDILHASRSIVWLKPDHIVVYDRAQSMTANRFKRFNLVLVDNPVITGSLAKVITSGKQNFYIQNLLPANATIKEQHFWTANTAEFNAVSNGDPARYRLTIEDSSNPSPSNVRFLHVLQGADAGVAQTATQLIQSQGGTFDGALVGKMAVLFPVNVTQPASSVTYTVPSTTTGHLITGLAPNTNYAVTQQNSGMNTQISVTQGAGLKTDNAGALVIGVVGP